VSIYFQYETTYRLLSELGLLPDGYRARRFWSVLGLSIVTGIGLIAGLVLLVVPAVILSVRWFVSVPALIGEEVGVFAALGAKLGGNEGTLLADIHRLDSRLRTDDPRNGASRAE